MTDAWQAYVDTDFLHSYRSAVEHLIESGGFDHLQMAGLSLIRLGRGEEGIALLKAAAVLRPASPQIYQAAAALLQELQSPDAEFFIDHGLRDFPDDEWLIHLRGNGLLLRGATADAIKLFEARLSGDPCDFVALINLGLVHTKTGDFAAAENYFIQAGLIVPTHRDVILGRAALYGRMARVDEAIELLTPFVEDMDARFMLSLFLLANGDYQRGWKLHLDRWYAMAFKQASRPPRPVEFLDQLENKNVAIVREGGFGDLFQFMRYIPMIADRATAVLLHTTPTDRPLLRYNLPDNVILQPIEAANVIIPPEYDYTVALLDLPYLAGTTIDTIPAPIPYIAVPPEIVLARALPQTTKRRVGLAWAGGAPGPDMQRNYDLRRSVDVSAFLALTSVPDIEFINLQLNVHSVPPLLDTLPQDANWLATAATVAQLDLVITVDTAMVHLAGAMGIETWLLSRTDACWRWLRNAVVNPWYPTVRVFGQKTYDDWTATIVEVRQALACWQFNHAPEKR